MIIAENKLFYGSEDYYEEQKHNSCLWGLNNTTWEL